MRSMSDMWVEHADDPRTSDTMVGEQATIRGYLDNYRLTLEMKCDGLGADELARRSVPPSTLSLLGLIRHMTKVEHHWFRRVLQGHPDEAKLFEREVDFDGAVADANVVGEAFAAWKAQVAAANQWLDALEEDALGQEVWLGDKAVPIRDVLIHMVEEYARHAGHADLLRECIDGRTGQ